MKTVTNTTEHATRLSVLPRWLMKEMVLEMEREANVVHTNWVHRQANKSRH